MKKAVVFPGQGSQVVGMGKELAAAFPVAKEVFQEVDDALSQKLSFIMFEGPEADLTLTENAQPAIMASSIAILRVMERQMGFSIKDTASFVAGHSLGEYTALCAAGSIPLAETARLLKLRGQAMQRAVPKGQGAMAAILGLEMDAVEALVVEAGVSGEVVAVANDNSPGQVVISGSAAGIEKASEIAKAKGAKRAVLLPVSAPFHCPLMQPAAEEMKAALARTVIQPPVVPLIANVTARDVSDTEVIRDLLVQQVCGRVRWRESVSYLHTQGVSQLIEIGVGKVLTGLAKRIEKEMDAICIASPSDLDGFAKAA